MSGVRYLLFGLEESHFLLHVFIKVQRCLLIAIEGFPGIGGMFVVGRFDSNVVGVSVFGKSSPQTRRSCRKFRLSSVASSKLLTVVPTYREIKAIGSSCCTVLAATGGWLLL